MKNIIKNLGQAVLAVLIAIATIISFLFMYDVLDYYNIGADNS